MRQQADARKIALSLMCADFLNLIMDLDLFVEFGVEYLHIDIVDGHFVHNITRFKDCIVTFHPETVTHPLNWPNRVFKDSARVGWAKIPSRKAV